MISVNIGEELEELEVKLKPEQFPANVPNEPAPQQQPATPEPALTPAKV